jgi:endonuclease YncB( thermonuclease family)
MAKRKQNRSYPRRSRGRSGSTSIIVSAIMAVAATAWYVWGDDVGIPFPTEGSGSVIASAPASSSNTSGPAAPEASPAPAGPSASASTGNVLAGTASVIDADTLDIGKQRIRLVGVDAPESGQKCLDANAKLVRCGTISANALDQWINRNPVSCNIEGKDRYQRNLGKCFVRDESVQDWLVRNGYAVAYRSYSTEFVDAEVAARNAKAGLWAGEFVMPWDWRKGKRLQVEIGMN